MSSKKRKISPLYRRLTKLFSGPLVNYRSQTEKQLKRRYLDKYNFKSLSGQTFKKTAYNPLENLTSELMSSQERVGRYSDFNQMEHRPELASALDIYADEMTTSSGLSKMLKIDCPNEEIKSILEALYTNILNVEQNLHGWCRAMCKYGDFYLYLDIDEDFGIKYVHGLPVGEIERMEGKDQTNPNYIQYQWNTGGITFESWQVAHFRALGNDKFAPYGTSVLDPARRIWRQLNLLEDAMMAYRIVRSPERRVFYIDIGNMGPEDVEQYIEKVKTQMKRNQVVNTNTGRVDLRYNPLSIDEDYFIPTRAGSTSRIETLPGGSYTGDIDDVKYMQNNLYAAIKVPQAYISRGEGANEDKSTLAQKDIRFARTVQRLQRNIISEMEKIGIIHLYTLGFKGRDLINFRLSLNNPSKIAEMQELEHWRTKFDVASTATDGFFSKRWVAKNIFNLSEEEFVRIQREMYHDAKFRASLEKVAEIAQQESGGDFMGTSVPASEATPPDGGEDGPVDLAGESPGDDPAGGGASSAEPESGDSPDSEDSAVDSLLAVPEAGAGKRDDRWYMSHRKKGVAGPKDKGKKYNPVASDSRSMGARKRSYFAADGESTNTVRSTFKGLSDLRRYSRGIYEEGQTSYVNEEENLLFEMKREVADLIKGMELKKNENETQ